MSVRSYRDLMVWKKGMDLAAAVYRLTRQMPKQEEYRISGQMIRAATSIPANIAEGHRRGTCKDYGHFVSIAKGSLAELETFLLLVANSTLRRQPLPIQSCRKRMKSGGCSPPSGPASSPVPFP